MFMRKRSCPPFCRRIEFLIYFFASHARFSENVFIFISEFCWMFRKTWNFPPLLVLSCSNAFCTLDRFIKFHASQTDFDKYSGFFYHFRQFKWLHRVQLLRFLLTRQKTFSALICSILIFHLLCDAIVNALFDVEFF